MGGRLLLLGQFVAETDVVVGAAGNLNGLGVLKGRDQNGDVGKLLGGALAQLALLVGAPSKQHVVFAQSQAVLQPAINLGDLPGEGRDGRGLKGRDLVP